MLKAMKHARVVMILVNVLLFMLSLNARGTWILAAPPCDFPAIYNFGDSNSDTGGISAAFWPISAPYGESFFRRPAGRDSDGRLIIDFIAEHLGLPYLSPYLDSLGANFRHGANFATGGSTVRRQNGSIFENSISPFSLDIQTVQFDQFKERSNELYREALNPKDRRRLPRTHEFSKSLYIFDIGQHDLAVGLAKLTMAQLHDAIPVMINQLVATIIHFYQQGARAFWIHNTGPIGCLPLTIMHIQNPERVKFDEYGCITGHNAIATEFNRQLKDSVSKLRVEVPHAALTYVDIYSAKYHLISKAKNYGFMDPLKICCGRHEENINVWCGQRIIVNGSEIMGGACASPAAYISWDGVHYTEAANQWIANNILNGSFCDPPVPIVNACLKH